jgi:cell division protease FtsH
MHLYDPAEVTDEEHRRTAVHELGHAIIIYETNPSNIPERISIKNEAGSLGRVTINTKHSYSTEVEILDFLAVLLGGKNAERLIFGTHAIGCSSDYARAKQVAAKMIEVYAMNTYGETSADIIKSADARSTEILVRHRSALERLAPILLEKQELTGQEFVDLMKQ